MKTKQVQLLYRLGLINPALVKSVEETWGVVNLLKAMDGDCFVLKVCQISLLIEAIFAPAALVSGKTNLVFTSPAWAILCFLIITLFLTALCIGIERASFAGRFMRLNDLLARYRNEDGNFIKYNLHRDMDWLRTKAETILMSAGKELRLSEMNNGVYSVYASQKREQFKDAHAILVEFGLADENQGKYIRDPETSSEPVAA